jgi:SAM-dependent methyltransferase
MAESPADVVEAQYEQWPYPAPTDDLVGWCNAPDAHWNDLRELHWAYWPQRPRREDLEILVAGCGTMAAASFAYLYPRAKVVGIDISETSLAHERKLKEKHGLSNVTVERCRVEDVEKLGRRFDYINASGVLHHTAEPHVGLAALGRTLREDGVVSVMVYGKYGREGVYMFQELFRRLGLEQSKQDLELVKATLRFASPGHPVQRYLRLANDLHVDAGIVDTFLHRRDKAYTVRDCLDLAKRGGLAFGGWEEPALYHPEAHLPPGHPLIERISRLNRPEMWEAVELLYGATGNHWFFAHRPDSPQAKLSIDFEGESFLDHVPITRIKTATAGANSTLIIQRPPFPPVQLAGLQAAVFRQIDGQRSVRQCLALATGAGPVVPVTEAARVFFRSLWRMGYVLFRL